MTKCPCGSDLSFEECCNPFLNGEKSAPTAEALMRARYSAYVHGNIDFIEQTMHSGSLAEFIREDSQKWADESEWHGLEILNVTGGKEEDVEGSVEFVATYTRNDERVEHHEISSFKKETGKWSFIDGHTVNKPFQRDQPKIGRNDPCHCGSGRKFKKCCG